MSSKVVNEPPDPLPKGACLLHVGAHKTGTTAIQAALWSARPSLLEQGVRHVGVAPNPSRAVRAVVGLNSPYGETPPPLREWTALVREFQRAREPRVVVSSEYFAWAEAEAIRRILGDLDADRVHVAVTLRPLARVMPSTWQQNVQQGATIAFDDWVREVLDDPSKPFWLLQRHDRLIARWQAALPPGRVTAIVVDDRDHGAVMRAFEGLLGLRAGTLPTSGGRENRSLSRPEADAIRAFNVAYWGEKLPRDLHARVMRFGAAEVMKRRPPAQGEQPVELPAWAGAALAPIQQQIVTGIRGIPIDVLGDLDALLRREPKAVRAGADATEPRHDGIPPEIAASLGMGLLESTGALRVAKVSRGPFKFAEPAEVLRVPTYQLVGTIAGRAWRATAGRLAGMLWRGGR